MFGLIPMFMLRSCVIPSSSVACRSGALRDQPDLAGDRAGATTEAAAGPILYSISNDLMSKAANLDPFYDTAMPPKGTDAYYTSLQGVLDGSVAPADAAKRLEEALKAK